MNAQEGGDGRQVPMAAILVVSAISVVIVLWLGIGAVVFIVDRLRGRGVPEFGDERVPIAVPGEGVTPPTATAHASDHPDPRR